MDITHANQKPFITVKITDKQMLTEFDAYEIIHRIQRAIKRKFLYNKDMTVEFSNCNINMIDLKSELNRLFFKPLITDIDENTIHLWFKEVQIV